MFSGIIECMGIVKSLIHDKGNITFEISAPFSDELKIDQSVAHNGACLTVIKVENGRHWVTAIDETLIKTNLGALQEGSAVNLERCIRLNDRLDGHIVQGHVDQRGICEHVTDANGSWLYSFSYDGSIGNVTVEKGSVCVNGVSLTVVDSGYGTFSVAIIPYTYEHTNFKFIQKGDVVNLEYDIIGKYIARLYEKGAYGKKV